MKLKRYKYLITVSYNFINSDCNIISSFVIAAIPVTKSQAKEIAKVLYPKMYNVRVVSVENIANDPE